MNVQPGESCPSQPTSPGRRILLAEDSHEDVFLLTEAFQTQNINVQIDSVTDGDLLLSRLLALPGNGSSSYGLVILDVHLPRRTGEEVLVLLKQNQRRLGIPLVVLTSMINDASKQRLIDLGVQEVFSKPFDLNEYFQLAQRLESLLKL